MLFNQAARDLVIETMPIVQLVSHDWWFYIVVAGCGGSVMYDPRPVLKYRQHSANLVGANTSLASQFARLRMVTDGQWRRWNEIHETALATLEGRLTKENRAVYHAFRNVRHGRWPWERLSMLKTAGLVRQNSFENLSLPLFTLLKKL